MKRIILAVVASAIVAAIFTAATGLHAAPPKATKTHYFSPQGWTDVRKAIVTELDVVEELVS